MIWRHETWQEYTWGDVADAWGPRVGWLGVVSIALDMFVNGPGWVTTLGVLWAACDIALYGWWR